MDILAENSIAPWAYVERLVDAQRPTRLWKTPFWGLCLTLSAPQP